VNTNDDQPKEIVIIRRPAHGHDEGHHGGMWKIAYADFMTAMMALFLVLWLVNSTDDETLAQVATYFNPVDLSDRTTTERGVHDKNQAGTGTKGEEKPNQSGNTDDDSIPRNDRGAASPGDSGLFADPYKVLAKLADEADSQARKEPGGDDKDGIARTAGEAFRDPFDPDFSVNSDREDPTIYDVNPNYDHSAERSNTERENNAGEMAFVDRLAEQVDAAAELAKQAEVPGDGDALKIRSELFRNIQQEGLANLPDISVEKTDEGVLISVTDQADFEMFAVSSAKPKPELVVLMEKLAEILAKQPGDVVIRGHTDARPFRSETYDNWRLSTARAHIAHYMLLRGGLTKDRIERIEGYADQELTLPDDPYAAQNRRIEILLKPENT